jgi:hypothetical protein
MSTARNLILVTRKVKPFARGARRATAPALAEPRSGSSGRDLQTHDRTVVRKPEVFNARTASTDFRSITVR